jgi:hypothetical protein
MDKSEKSAGFAVLTTPVRNCREAARRLQVRPTQLLASSIWRDRPVVPMTVRLAMRDECQPVSEGESSSRSSRKRPRVRMSSSAVVATGLMRSGHPEAMNSSSEQI